MYLICLLLTVAWATTTSLETDCIQVHSIKGNKLSGHDFTTFTESDLMKCFQTCKRQRACQSINYKLDGSVCELNNQTREARPSYFITADQWLYFDNPSKRSSKSIPGRSCKDIRDSAGESELTNQKFWIDPGNSLQPFSVYCDMKTDGGGWTLIARTLVQTDNETINDLIKESNYHQISKYTSNSLRIDVPAVRMLRQDMGFSQLRYFCRKKSTGRTVHIITKKTTMGGDVVRYFTEDNINLTSSCGSYFRGPGDNSVIAMNCGKWGHDGNSAEVGKWGFYTHNGPYRMYNDPMFWNGTSENYFTNFIPGRLCCDEDRRNISRLSVGDLWMVFVR